MEVVEEAMDEVSGLREGDERVGEEREMGWWEKRGRGEKSETMTRRLIKGD